MICPLLTADVTKTSVHDVECYGETCAWYIPHKICGMPGSRVIDNGNCAIFLIATNKKEEVK